MITELSKLYFERTGESPEHSLYSWLGMMFIEETDEAFQDILDNPDKYFGPKEKTHENI